MKIKLVADSSANLLALDGASFASVPMKVIAGESEYVDDPSLDLPGMLKGLKEYKGKSGTACPSVGEWLAAFGDADVVLGVTITSNLSGCYNAADIAKREYEAKRPDAKVFILDSLSTGPEMVLILEKYAELINAGLTFEQIVEEIKAYSKKTHLMFSLASLSNFAKNGRVSQAVAAAVGLLNIRVVGKASDEGMLEPMHKCRGDKKAMVQLLACMEKAGFCGGKVHLTHTYNLETAEKFAEMLKQKYADVKLSIRQNLGLCSYYAEEGALLVGFEG
ncbi:MAG: DegV family EDD domain-containing protein [Clostridiales bacterium]|nr:DegV family EDD domain-containing protein [Clostridiales bacterium]